MSIKITLSTLKAVPDTLTLYWDTAPFTPETLPANTVTLSPSATTYTDTTVPANTTRYYMVKATKAGLDDMFSQCMLYGNFAKTGPGSNTVLRGDWNAGLMDILTPAQMFTVTGLKSALGLAGFGGSVADSVVTAWYKFVYKGKILFIPNAPLSNASVLRWPDLYNNGLIYGVDGTGSVPFDLVAAALSPAVAAPVNQKRVVTVGSDSFLVRAPRLSTQPTNEFAASDKSTFVGSEWWETMARVGVPALWAAEDVAPMGSKVYGDTKTPVAPWSCAATQHFLTNPNACCVSNGNWTGFISRSAKGTAAAAWVHWVPVLEYIPA